MPARETQPANAYPRRLHGPVGTSSARLWFVLLVPPVVGSTDGGTAHRRNTVSLYQRRYPSMPRPVIDLGRGRCNLAARAQADPPSPLRVDNLVRVWLRSEVDKWRSERL